MPNPWTDNETETALRLYSRGHTFSDIARTLKRTRGEIAGKLFRERRNGKVDSRLGKDRPPPRETKNPKNPKPPPVPSKPRPPQPIRRIKVSPDHRPHPPQHIMPKPVGQPTCWELGPYDCRFPIGRR